ncbi:hypothetical protein VP01_2213g1 [Puccinia sorghi]|uniref:Uncharacterized protein n=1 Tax=Puccinia sorghi TaxID=27349 RepID=A0A0L6V911_9BASI|nr:hypothetical protein VP01_2213g1 [Puccinia sorghi]
MNNSRLLLFNKLDALKSTLNINPTNYSQENSFASNKQQQPNEQQQQQQPNEQQITHRLRLWRDDARAQHLYQTAAFWGSKVFNITSNPNDAFWLAQVFFLTGQFFRAEKVLTSAKRINPTTLQQPSSSSSSPSPSSPLSPLSSSSSQSQVEQPDITHDFSFWDDLLPDNKNTHSDPEQQQHTETILVRMTDYSTACRYLAAQCMIRQGKWDAALEMVGDQNPFRNNNNNPTPSPSSPNNHNKTHQDSTTSEHSKRFNNTFLQQDAGSKPTIDGGIKFESSMCYLRGLIHLHNKALDRAKESFLESLALDVKCYESFEALVGGNMLEPEEEWEFIQSLEYHSQTPEDALFIQSLYTVRLKKFNHKEDLFQSLKVLKNQYHLSDDPDTAFGLADWLYTNYRFIDCYRVTSRILKLHYHHLPTLPLHLSSMTMIKKLLPSLFLLAHELIERDPSSPISWYGAGLWYFSQKRWEESRRFFSSLLLFSKAALLDSRFPEAWFAFGHALAYEGEHDQAITAYSTASHNFQGSHLPLLFIGMQHIQLANPSLAHDYLSAAAEICPFDPLVMQERGVVCYYQEQWEEAVEFFTNTLALVQKAQTDPVIWAPTHLNLAHCYRRLRSVFLTSSKHHISSLLINITTRRFGESLASAEKAKSLMPRSAAVLSALGMAQMGVGSPEKAIRYYHEVSPKARDVYKTMRRILTEGKFLKSLAIVPADPMTTSLLQFALDLETRPSEEREEEGEEEGEGQLARIVPRPLRQSWARDVRDYDANLDRRFGSHVSAHQVLRPPK